MKRKALEVLGYLALTGVALALRLIDLDARPFHHDESQDAYFSWLFYTDGDYTYQPILHGPLRFYLTAAMYLLFGDSDFTARLAPALMGTAMVPMCALLRGQLGRLGAFSAAIALTFGPTFLYYSRFAREDIYFAAITLALIAVAARFLDRPRAHQPALLGALLALSFATKETTFITAFVAGTFFLVAIAEQTRLHGFRNGQVIRAVTAVGWEAWAWALASFLAVFTLLFTVFLTDPGGLWSGIYDGIDYWLSQHGPGRGESEEYFYSVVLAAVEWPIVLLGITGAVATYWRPSILRAFLIWDFILSLVVYSLANERFSWLVMHPLLPLTLLAGFGVQVIWESRHAWGGKLGLALIVLAVLHTGYASFRVNAQDGADPREFLVTTQSSDEVVGVRDEVFAAKARADREGRDLNVVVDSAEGATFPWAWYFRHLDATYPDLTREPLPSEADVVIATQGGRDAVAQQLAGYDGREFPFRVWWVRDYDEMSPGAWWDWFTKREPWNPTGGMPEWLCVRQGA
ncbi:MAG: flippase activity-associated protein Agl23 [Solirubrobacteraceae bacterium]